VATLDLPPRARDTQQTCAIQGAPSAFRQDLAVALRAGSPGAGGRVKVWDVETWEVLYNIPGQYAFCLSRDGARIVCAQNKLDRDEDMGFFDSSTGECL
jgi:hypothetical protein